MVRPAGDSLGASFPKDSTPSPQQQIDFALERIWYDLYTIKDTIHDMSGGINWSYLEGYAGPGIPDAISNLNDAIQIAGNIKPSDPNLISDLNTLKDLVNKINNDMKSQNLSNIVSDLNKSADIIKKYGSDPYYPWPWPADPGR